MKSNSIWSLIVIVSFLSAAAAPVCFADSSNETPEALLLENLSSLVSMRDTLGEKAFKAGTQATLKAYVAENSGKNATENLISAARTMGMTTPGSEAAMRQIADSPQTSTASIAQLKEMLASLQAPMGAEYDSYSYARCKKSNLVFGTLIVASVVVALVLTNLNSYDMIQLGDGIGEVGGFIGILGLITSNCNPPLTP